MGEKDLAPRIGSNRITSAVFFLSLAKSFVQESEVGVRHEAMS